MFPKNCEENKEFFQFPSDFEGKVEKLINGINELS